jgi:DNA-binding PadR family transcriptional regulator
MCLRHGLLALLDSGPRRGDQLKAAFEAATGGGWAIDTGQLYATLDRLARDGSVVVQRGDDGGRRTYDITEEGRSELKSWLGAALAEARPPREELLLKVLLALATPSVDAREVIQAQRSAIVEALQARRGRLRAQARSDDALAVRLVGDALVVGPEADLRWLDLCDERLVAQAATEPTRRTPR